MNCLAELTKHLRIPSGAKLVSKMVTKVTSADGSSLYTASFVWRSPPKAKKLPPSQLARSQRRREKFTQHKIAERVRQKSQRTSFKPVQTLTLPARQQLASPQFNPSPSQPEFVPSPIPQPTQSTLTAPLKPQNSLIQATSIQPSPSPILPPEQNDVVLQTKPIAQSLIEVPHIDRFDVQSRIQNILTSNIDEIEQFEKIHDKNFNDFDQLWDTFRPDLQNETHEMWEFIGLKISEFLYDLKERTISIRNLLNELYLLLPPQDRPPNLYLQGPR